MFGKKKGITEDQKTVIKGILIGIVLTLACFYLSCYLVPSFMHETQWIMDRLVLALMMNIFPAFLLFIMFAVVASSRTLNPHLIHPLEAKEDKSFKINSRVYQNTLEQFVLFFISSIVFAMVAAPESMKMLPVMTDIFIIGRIIFWIAYHVSPLYRSIGVTMTAVYVPFLLYSVYEVFMVMVSYH